MKAREQASYSSSGHIERAQYAHAASVEDMGVDHGRRAVTMAQQLMHRALVQMMLARLAATRVDTLLDKITSPISVEVKGQGTE